MKKSYQRVPSYFCSLSKTLHISCKPVCAKFCFYLEMIIVPWRFWTVKPEQQSGRTFNLAFRPQFFFFHLGRIFHLLFFSTNSKYIGYIGCIYDDMFSSLEKDPLQQTSGLRFGVIHHRQYKNLHNCISIGSRKNKNKRNVVRFHIDEIPQIYIKEC